MSCSSAFKSLLSFVLLLSIAWKIAIPSNRQSDPNAGLVEFLNRNHFDVSVTEQSGVPIIQAKALHAAYKLRDLRPMDRTGISFETSRAVQIACSSSFAVRRTPNSRFCGPF